MAGPDEYRRKRGKDLGERFAAVARELPRALRAPDRVVDGEVCALDEQGRPSFALMQQGAGALALQLFDLLALAGEPLLGLPLAERRSRLEAILDPRSSVGAFSSTRTRTARGRRSPLPTRCARSAARPSRR